MSETGRLSLFSAARLPSECIFAQPEVDDRSGRKCWGSLKVNDPLESRLQMDRTSAGALHWHMLHVILDPNTDLGHMCMCMWGRAMAATLHVSAWHACASLNPDLVLHK
jgi:hypothetical protein